MIAIAPFLPFSKKFTASRPHSFSTDWVRVDACELGRPRSLVIVNVPFHYLVAEASTFRFAAKPPTTEEALEGPVATLALLRFLTKVPSLEMYKERRDSYQATMYRGDRSTGAQPATCFMLELLVDGDEEPIGLRVWCCVQCPKYRINLSVALQAAHNLRLAKQREAQLPLGQQGQPKRQKKSQHPLDPARRYREVTSSAAFGLLLANYFRDAERLDTLTREAHGHPGAMTLLEGFEEELYHQDGKIQKMHVFSPEAHLRPNNEPAAMAANVGNIHEAQLDLTNYLGSDTLRFPSSTRTWLACDPSRDVLTLPFPPEIRDAMARSHAVDPPLGVVYDHVPS
jgi:hypothetical protein